MLTLVPKKLLVGIAIVLGLVVLGLSRESDNTGIDSVLPCVARVTADVLNVRAAPGTGSPVVDTLSGGHLVNASRTVQDGFRQIDGERWVADEFLEPTTGSHC